MMTKNGLSTDGTTAFLNRLRSLYPRQTQVIRIKGGNPWLGNVAVVRAGMTGIRDGDLLLQLDSDELRVRIELQWARVPGRFFMGLLFTLREKINTAIIKVNGFVSGVIGRGIIGNPTNLPASSGGLLKNRLRKSRASSERNHGLWVWDLIIMLMPWKNG